MESVPPIQARANAVSKSNPWDAGGAWARRTVRIESADGGVNFEQEVEAPANWSDRAVAIVASKYFRGNAGDPDREDSVRSLVSRVCETIAGWHPGAPSERAFLRDDLIRLTLSQALAFNTPVWLNVGVDDVPQASACFISSVDDHLASIMEFASAEARIFQRGGGSGANLSRLRADGESLSKGGTASGPVSFMRGLDAFAGVIKSGGRMRRAAKGVVLDADHPDVFAFVDCKRLEEVKARALAKLGVGDGIDGGAYASVHYQNANHSVRVTDEFMRAVEADLKWDLTARVSGEVLATVWARDLFSRICEAAHACGDPGLQFEDAINAWHTCPSAGRINASNPCSEFVFLDDSACNLASLNLRAFQRPDGSLDRDSFRRAVAVAITAQDAVVDRAAYPTEKIGANAHRFRPLGLGYANLGAFLMYAGIPYDSDDGRRVAAEITSLMTASAYRCSAELAEKFGTYEGFEALPAIRVLRKHAECAPGESRPAWEAAIEAALRHGLRNAQVTLLAPTGTIAFMMDCFTADTLVAVADGRNAVSFGELAREGKDVDVYASEDGRTVVRKMRDIRKVRADVALVRVNLDDGSFVRCTPEHQFMLRDGTYRSAIDLSPGDSLMRFDSVIKDETGNLRRKIWMGPSAGGNRVRGESWVHQYRLSGARLFPGYDARSGGIVHHDNEDALDDRYDNLVYCDDIGAHQRAHWAKKSATERSAILRARQATRTPEERREASRKAHAAQTPEQRRARGLKAVAGRSSEDLSGAAVRGWAGISKEKRRERALKAWETRRRSAGTGGKNHKVVDVISDGVEDVYCGQVDEVRNFAIVTSGGIDAKNDDLSGVVVHNCDTTGVEPDISLLRRKALVGGGVLEMCSETAAVALMNLGYHREANAVEGHLLREGSMEGLVDAEHLPVFDCALPDSAGRCVSALGHVKMVAAVQPFLSGAVSKTVNLPNSATVEDVRGVYEAAWKRGLKAIIVYRDGCKAFQPVTSGAPKAPQAAVGAPDALESGTGTAEPPVAEDPTGHRLETSTRVKLPEEIPSIRRRFDLGGVAKGYVHAGLYPDGRVGEIFIRMAKEGSALSGAMDALATACSIGLQHGVPLELLVRKFSHWRFDPSGQSGDPEIGYAHSVVDFAFRWLGLRFLKNEEAEAVGASTRRRVTAAYDALPAEADAPFCPNCQAQMRRNGTCHVCAACGSTSGCS